jgi:hypothetical protein
MTMVSYRAGSAKSSMAFLMSSKRAPVTSVSELKGTYPTVRRAP